MWPLQKDGRYKRTAVTQGRPLQKRSAAVTTARPLREGHAPSQHALVVISARSRVNLAPGAPWRSRARSHASQSVAPLPSMRRQSVTPMSARPPATWKGAAICHVEAGCCNLPRGRGLLLSATWKVSSPTNQKGGAVCRLVAHSHSLTHSHTHARVRTHSHPRTHPRLTSPISVPVSSSPMMITKSHAMVSANVRGMISPIGARRTCAHEERRRT